MNQKEQSEISNLKTYTFKGKKGITDLEGLFAFTGSWGQGDHYSSNDASIEHPSYVSFVFTCPKTQKDINEEIERRKKRNSEYIERLKFNGEYGKEYDINCSFIPHPMFDESGPFPNINGVKSLMSSSFIIFGGSEPKKVKCQKSGCGKVLSPPTNHRCDLCYSYYQ